VLAPAGLAAKILRRFIGPPAKERAKQEKAATMTDTPPDRLCADPTSPHYDGALLARGVGIRFKGVERTNVEEYCVSEGWVRLTVGATRDRKGRPLTITLRGEVEPYFRSSTQSR